MKREFIYLEDVKISDLKNVDHTFSRGVKYEFQEVDSRIAVIESDFIGDNETWVSTTSDNAGESLLYDVLGLVNISENYSPDEHVLLVDPQKALQWFSKYGMPDYGYEFRDRHGKLAYDYELFCNKAIVLAACMKLLSACESESRDEILKRLEFLYIACYIDGSGEKFWLHKGMLQSNKNDYMKEKATRDVEWLKMFSFVAIRKVIKRYMKNIFLETNLRATEIRMSTNDSTSLWFYQLATLMNHYEKEKTKESHKELLCKNPDCRALIWGHGNKKYCPNCDRRTMYSRTPEAKEKRRQKAKKAGES